MKKTIATAVLFLLSTSPAFAGGVWSALSTSNWPTVEPTYYLVEAHGYDMRAYEWDMKNNPGYSCIFLASEKTAEFRCYPNTSAKAKK